MNSANQSESQSETEKAEKQFSLLLQQLKHVMDNEILFDSTSLLNVTLADISHHFDRVFDRKPETIEVNIARREQISEILATCQTMTSRKYYSNIRRELRDLKELSCSHSTLQLAQQLLSDANLRHLERNFHFGILTLLFGLDLRFRGFLHEKQCQQVQSTRSGLIDATAQRVELVLALIASDEIPRDYFPLIVPILQTHCDGYRFIDAARYGISAELPSNFKVHLALISTLLQITPCDYAKPLAVIEKLIFHLNERHTFITNSMTLNYRGYTEEEYRRTEKPTIFLTRILLLKQAAQIHFANNCIDKAEQCLNTALKDNELLEELAAAGCQVQLPPTEAINEIKDYFQAKSAKAADSNQPESHKPN